MITCIILFVIDLVDERKNFIPEKVKEESLLFQPMADLIPNLLPFLGLDEFDWEKPGENDDSLDTVRS